MNPAAGGYLRNQIRKSKSMSSPRLLILGAVFHQKALFTAAKKRGLVVYAVDKNPETELTSLADYFFPISTDDVDQLVSLIKREQIAYITTGATFDAIYTAAVIKERLNLPSLLPSSKCLTVALDKAKTRAVLEKAGLPVPTGGVATTLEEAWAIADRLTFPLIVKPAYASGSKGNSKIHSLRQLPKAFLEAQRANQRKKTRAVVFEEIIIGKVLSVEAITIGKKTYTVAAGEIDELPGNYNPVVGTITPAKLPAATYQTVCTLNDQVMTALGINNGATHVNYIVDKHGQPYLIDCNRRLGGGEIVWDSIPRSYQVDLSDMVTELALGERPKVNYSFQGIISGLKRLIPPQSGKFYGLTWDKKVQKRLSIGGVYLYLKPGTAVTASPKVTGDLVGSITSWGKTHAAVTSQLAEFEKILNWDIRQTR